MKNTQKIKYRYGHYHYCHATGKEKNLKRLVICNLDGYKLASNTYNSHHLIHGKSILEDWVKRNSDVPRSEFNKYIRSYYNPSIEYDDSDNNNKNQENNDQMN